MKNRTFAVVLGAGSAQRFGSPKQTAPYRGLPLLRHAMTSAEHVFGHRTLLILGARWQTCFEASGLRQGYFAINDRHEDGLSSSIATATRALAPVAEALVFILGDQPLVPDKHLHDIVLTWNGAKNRIVCTSAPDYRGPPVLFPAHYFEELSKLRGDRGARDLLHTHRSSVVSLACEAALSDVDTPEDLERLNRT